MRSSEEGTRCWYTLPHEIRGAATSKGTRLKCGSAVFGEQGSGGSCSRGNITYRKHVTRQSLKLSVDEVADLRGGREYPLETHLRIYLCKVSPLRCCNFDETSVCLSPLGTRGWKDKQEVAMAATDGKLWCTEGLEMQKECSFLWYSHIILQGTIWRTLPKAWPGIMRCACLDIREQQGQGSAPDPWFFSSMLLFSTLRMLIALRCPNTSTY